MEELLKPTQVIKFDENKATDNLKKYDWSNKETDLREGVKSWQQ